MKRFAFTMAEILISLTIIGIIAAITLPALQGNINEKTWATQKKALHSRMAQAISMMPALNGYGIGANDTETINNAASAFVTEGLGKNLKINNVCDNTHLTDCGVPTKVTTMSDTAINFPTKLSEFNPVFTGSYNPQKDTKAAAFETANGESVVVYYNPYCVGPDAHVQFSSVNSITYPHKDVFHSHGFMCANFVYDLNGSKGPNTFGKDIGFITALYSSDPVVVAPVPIGKNTTDGLATFDNARSLCTTKEENSRVPNIDELVALTYNSQLVNLTSIGSTQSYWSSSLVDDTYVWVANIAFLLKGQYGKTSTLQVRCIKR